MKVLAIFSGGMDSATAIAKTIKEGHEVSTVSFDYGSKHNDREWEYAQKFCQHYKIGNDRIPLDFIRDYFESDLLKSGGDIPDGHYADPSMKRTVVPFRNGIMLAIACGLAESWGYDSVLIGNHFGDHAVYPDCRQGFIIPMARAMDRGTYSNISLLSPFENITKTDIAELGSQLGVPYELTYSCYKGGVDHCGTCGTCVERKEAFRDSGVPDPTRYEA